MDFHHLPSCRSPGAPRLNGWPTRPPADASPTSSRMPAHGLGPMWAATPSSQWTCTTYSLPVYRRTCAKTRAFNLLVESSSLFGQSENQKCWRRLSGEGYRETGSTLSWLAHIFTRPGSNGEGPGPAAARPVHLQHWTSCGRLPPLAYQPWGQ